MVVKNLKKLAEARMIIKVETLSASFARKNTSHILRSTHIISSNTTAQNPSTPMLQGVEEDQGRFSYKISQVKLSITLKN